MIQGLPSSVMGWLAGRMVAGWMAIGEFTWFYADLPVSTWIYMNLGGISVIQELGCTAGRGSLWCPLAPFGRKLWLLYNTMLRGEGW